MFKITVCRNAILPKTFPTTIKRFFNSKINVHVSKKLKEIQSLIDYITKRHTRFNVHFKGEHIIYLLSRVGEINQLHMWRSHH